MENFRNKPFMTFTSCAVLHSVVKSFTATLYSAWDVNHSSASISSLLVLPLLLPPRSHPSIRLTVMGWQFLCSTNIQSSDACNSHISRRSYKVLPLSEKMKLFYLIGHFIISHHHKTGEYITIILRVIIFNFYYSVLYFISSHC